MQSPFVFFKLKSFRPGRWLTIFFLVFFPIFLLLGNWQLNRAEEKSQLATQIDQPTRPYISEFRSHLAPYQSFRITGKFRSEPLFFMDNRTYNGQAGYEIWAFFDTDEGSWLVAAGWLAGGNSRSQMPAVVLSKLTQTIEIMVRPDSINPLYGVETNQPIDGGEKQWLVQSLSAQWVNQKWPQVAMLGLAQSKDSELVGVGPTIWQPSVMTVEKHLGYAVQWFGMSIALLGMFLYAGWKQDDNNNKE